MTCDTLASATLCRDMQAYGAWIMDDFNQDGGKLYIYTFGMVQTVAKPGDTCLLYGQEFHGRYMKTKFWPSPADVAITPVS